MNNLRHPSMVEAPNFQIWRNNAAFDIRNSIEPTPLKESQFPPTPCFHNPSSPSQDFKENQSPVFANDSVTKSYEKPLKLLFKQRIQCPPLTDLSNKSEDGDIDGEIEEIEREISRLEARLEVLRSRKAEKEVKENEKIGELVEKKQSITKREFRRRGLSLGPSESDTGIRSQPRISIQSRQNRRNSCFPKIQQIDEGKVVRGTGIGTVKVKAKVKKPQELNSEKVSKQRGRSSLIQVSKRGLTTSMGAKKGLKREIGIMSSVQPKQLFSVGENSVGLDNKPIKNVRVIGSSRYYNQISLPSTRKRSLPEENKDGFDEKSDSFKQDLGLNQVNGSRRVKKRWEIPSEIIIHESLEESPPPIVSKRSVLLPKIRTRGGCIKETPRDSGPAKRAAELVGRKSYFGMVEEETTVCQALSFDDDDDEE